MAPATKGKKTGKENAPPAKSKPVEMDPDDSFGDVSMELPAVSAKGSKLVGKGTKGTKGGNAEEDEQDAGSSSDLSRKLASVTAERDRLRKHRDEVSKQFEDLARLRNTESEKLFSRYKASAETAANAQNDIIANLTTLNDKHAMRITSLEKSLASASLRSSGQAPPAEVAPAPAPAPAPSTLSKSEQKELKALREEVGKLRSGVKEKDTKIAQLEQEYRAEVANSLSLQRSTRGAPSTSTAAPPDSEDAEKDQLSLAFYEDMTELAILNVKIRRDAKNGKEATLNCLYTNQETKRTLQFKIRTYQEISQDLVAQKAENPWVRMVHYQPESLASETDKELVKRLGVFSEEFSIERKQLGQMWDDLRAKVSGEEDEDEDEDEEE